MSTYRVTIKYWDRHYGDGHVQFKRNFEARTSSKADQEAISILENALKSHSKPQGRIAEAWAERSDRGYPSTLRKYDGSSGQWVQVNPVRPAVARESLRVADFSTLPDLIKHAKSDLGATHVSGQGAETRIYFPLGSGQYEEATVWQKGNYWHATGPGARQRVSKPPRDAKPITRQGMRWASEAFTKSQHHFVNGWNQVEPGIKVWVSGDEPTRVQLSRGTRGREFAENVIRSWWGSQALHFAWTDASNADISRDYTQITSEARRPSSPRYSAHQSEGSADMRETRRSAHHMPDRPRTTRRQ